jgi:hypothetical protein
MGSWKQPLLLRVSKFELYNGIYKREHGSGKAIALDHEQNMHSEKEFMSAIELSLAILLCPVLQILL